MIPDWRTSGAGARVRVALWLTSEVGEGGIFTKLRLREAFPTVEQVDRRMRDLRPEGWSILTAAEDATLAPEELRLARIGGRVWEQGYASKAKAALSAKERQEIFRSDDYQCVVCGTGGGEPYPDEPSRIAKLTVSRGVGADGRAARTLCDRCQSGKAPFPAVDEVLRHVRSLEPEERRVLGRWLQRGARERTPLEQVWAEMRMMSSSDRNEVREALGSSER